MKTTFSGKPNLFRGLVLSIFMSALVVTALGTVSESTLSSCDQTTPLDSLKVDSDQPIFLHRQVRAKHYECYSFFIKEENLLSISTNHSAYLITPKESLRVVPESEKIQLSETGAYKIKIYAIRKFSRRYNIKLRLSKQPLPNTPKPLPSAH